MRALACEMDLETLALVWGVQLTEEVPFMPKHSLGERVGDSELYYCGYCKAKLTMGKLLDGECEATWQAKAVAESAGREIPVIQTVTRAGDDS